MKELIADLHMHTLVSGHAYGTMQEMAASAHAKGLQLIGISEHGPGIPGTVHPFYYSNLEVIPDFIQGVEVLHGCEINVLQDGTLSLDEEYMQYLDYGITGIHQQCYVNEGIQKNTDHVIACMKHPKIYFISHPDDDHTPLDYERLVAAAKKYHVALEVNNSSLLKKQERWHCYENYETMLTLCQRFRVPVLVSSDAHEPSAVGRFDLAYELLRTGILDEELILNNDITKLKAFIEI